MEIYPEAASIARELADSAFHTGMAVTEAEMDANFDQLNRMAETKNLQDFIRLQMTWGANQTLAICRAPSKADAFDAVGGALGAFEAGVVKALESENIFPDIVAGVSIGALNGAIIAANPR
jgi:Patatin-like phospholipase